MQFLMALIRCGHNTLELNLNQCELSEDLSVTKPRRPGSMKFNRNKASNVLRQQSINHSLWWASPIQVHNRRLLEDGCKILENPQEHLSIKLNFQSGFLWGTYC